MVTVVTDKDRPITNIRTTGSKSMTATAQILSPLDAWREIAARNISLTPVFDGRIWIASVDQCGEGHNRKRALRSVSAMAATPLAAIQALIETLDAERAQESGQIVRTNNLGSVETLFTERQ